MTEHEITAPVDLLLSDGRQNPAAIGWSRQLLHNTDALGSAAHRRSPVPYAWGRNKRWEYWAITTPTHVIALTIAGLDFASLHQLWVLDRATLTPIDTVCISPLSLAVRLPGTLGAGSSRARPLRQLGLLGAGSSRARTRGLRIDIDEVPGGTRLRARSERVRIDITATIPSGHEVVATSSPFSPRLAQFTIKDVDRPAHGAIWVDGTVHPVPEGASWAVLDHARARSPYGTHWNWAAGSGQTDGHRIGLQFGGGGRRYDGPSQNAFTVDGRVHKIAEFLEWDYDTENWLAPWKITNARVELTFTPYYDRIAKMNFLVVASATHQCFGRFDGWLVDDAGARIRVENVEGWAEDVHNRW